MAYTVKQVATMSKISVRTLHFYNESGLLKPPYYNDAGYRFYEEPQPGPGKGFECNGELQQLTIK